MLRDGACGAGFWTAVWAGIGAEIGAEIGAGLRGALACGPGAKPWAGSPPEEVGAPLSGRAASRNACSPTRSAPLASSLSRAAAIRSKPRRIRSPAAGSMGPLAKTERSRSSRQWQMLVKAEKPSSPASPLSVWSSRSSSADRPASAGPCSSWIQARLSRVRRSEPRVRNISRRRRSATLWGELTS